MHDIDFLPADYVCIRETRSSNNWLRALWVTLATLVAVSWIAQASTTRQLIAHRNELHRQTQELRSQLGSHEVRFHEMAAAENRERLLDLLLFNAYPSQWLSTLSGALPPQVTLREIRSALEDIQNPHVLETNTDNSSTVLDDEPTNSVERDLERLARLAERRSLVISLRGAASDDMAVSSYLNALQRTNVFDHVQLLFTDQEHPRGGVSRTFAIRLRVLPIPDRLARQQNIPAVAPRPSVIQASRPK